MSDSMKPCSKCRKTLALSKFNSNRSTKSGLSYYCKGCHRKICAIYRRSNKEKIKKYNKEYVQTEKGREVHLASSRKQWVTSPEKRKAHNKVNHALRKGKLERPDKCESCGIYGFVEAHHPDYGRPFGIDWLCNKCHNELHSLRRIACG